MNQEKQAFVIIFILVVLTAGILILIAMNKGGGTTSLDYNGYEIQETREGNYVGYRTRVFINNQGPFFMNTRYSPKDLEDIPIEEKLRPYLDNKTEFFVHITDLNSSFKGETTIAALEFNSLIERFYSIPVKYEDNINDCNSSDNDTLVMDFRLGNQNKVNIENGCIIAEAITQKDFIRIADRIIFHLLGIMD